MSLTFITALLDLQESERTRLGNKGLDQYLNYFKELVDGVPSMKIVVFVSNSYLNSFLNAIQPTRYSDRMMVIVQDLDDTWVYKQTKPCFQILKLPEHRTYHHDTRNFLLTQNSKLGFVKQVMELNPYQSTHFSWIDFGIVHVFKNKPSTFASLEELCNSTLNTKSKIILPGCYTSPVTNYGMLLTHVVWRFCGGFLLGDMDTMKRFINLFESSYMYILSQCGRITWEVNVWAFVESNEPNLFQWYPADHNDTIIKIPKEFVI